MPPTRPPYSPVPGRLYTIEKARAINEDWIRYGTTGTYHGWVNARNGNPIFFGPRPLPSGDAVSVKPVKPNKPKKMVDRSQDWKKGGRE